MHSFEVAFRSFEDVRDFVFLASGQSFEITVSSGDYRADARSLMVMLSLDYSQPLKVSANCTGEEFSAFLEAAKNFRV